MQSLFLNSLGGPGEKAGPHPSFHQSKKTGHRWTQFLCKMQTWLHSQLLKHDPKKSSENGANGSCAPLGHWEKTEKGLIGGNEIL